MPKTQFEFKVSDEHWKKAALFFKDPKNDDKKMDRKKTGLPFSFVKIAGEIYAFSNKACFDPLGEGALGKVKMIENRQGERFAVKIEGKGSRGEQEAEMKIGQMIGLIKGEGVRQLGREIMYKGQNTEQKRYIVMQLQKGKELMKILYMNLPDGSYAYSGDISQVQKMLIALKSCEVIQQLHNNGIIHADIKPENFVADLMGNTLTLSAIDFGFSMLMQPGKQFVRADPRGTPGYTAPEISYGEFSPASDRYALGVMFRNDLELPRGIWNGLLVDDPFQRENLLNVMMKIVQRLDMVKHLKTKQEMRHTLLDSKFFLISAFENQKKNALMQGNTELAKNMQNKINKLESTMFAHQENRELLSNSRPQPVKSKNEVPSLLATPAAKLPVQTAPKTNTRTNPVKSRNPHAKRVVPIKPLTPVNQRKKSVAPAKNPHTKRIAPVKPITPATNGSQEKKRYRKK